MYVNHRAVRKWAKEKERKKKKKCNTGTILESIPGLNVNASNERAKETITFLNNPTPYFSEAFHTHTHTLTHSHTSEQNNELDGRFFRRAFPARNQWIISDGNTRMKDGRESDETERGDGKDGNRNEMDARKFMIACQPAIFLFLFLWLFFSLLFWIRPIILTSAQRQIHR